MIIELGKYNEIRELLIENRATGSQGHVHYWDGGQRVSVTKVAVCMEVKDTGCIQSASESGMRAGTCKTTAE